MIICWTSTDHPGDVGIKNRLPHLPERREIGFSATHGTNRAHPAARFGRAGIKTHAVWRGLRTQLMQQSTIESDLDAHTSDLEVADQMAYFGCWTLAVGATGLWGLSVYDQFGCSEHRRFEEDTYERATIAAYADLLPNRIARGPAPGSFRAQAGHPIAATPRS